MKRKYRNNFHNLSGKLAAYSSPVQQQQSIYTEWGYLQSTGTERPIPLILKLQEQGLGLLLLSGQFMNSTALARP